MKMFPVKQEVINIKEEIQETDCPQDVTTYDVSSIYIKQEYYCEENLADKEENLSETVIDSLENESPKEEPNYSDVQTNDEFKTDNQCERMEMDNDNFNCTYDLADKEENLSETVSDPLENESPKEEPNYSDVQTNDEFKTDNQCEKMEMDNDNFNCTYDLAYKEENLSETVSNPLENESPKEEPNYSDVKTNDEFKTDNQCERIEMDNDNYNCTYDSTVGLGKYKCDQCNFICKYESRMTTHKLIHTNERPNKCDQCDYSSVWKSELVRHKLTHGNERPLKCDQCEYSSVRKCNLIRHKLTHSNERSNKCDQCEYSSILKYNLIRHKLTHTNERSNKCDECDYSCTLKSALIRHKLTHTNERPFKCDQCEHSSKNMSYLTKHKLTHSNERPFKCDECEYSSAQKRNLVSHKLIHRYK